MSDMLTCSHCQTANRAGSKFCNNCGTPLQAAATTRRCPHCQTANPLTNYYCDQCGQRMISDDLSKRRETDQKTESGSLADTPPKVFSLPTREPGETGELTPDAVLDWLKEPKGSAEPQAADAPHQDTPKVDNDDEADDAWVAELSKGETGILSIPETGLLRTIDFEGAEELENDDFADLLELGSAADALPDWLADIPVVAEPPPPPTEPDSPPVAAETAVSPPIDTPPAAAAAWLTESEPGLADEYDWLSAMESLDPDALLPPPPEPPPATAAVALPDPPDPDEPDEWHYTPIQTESELPDWLHELHKPSDEDAAWDAFAADESDLVSNDALPDWVQEMRPQADQTDSALPSVYDMPPAAASLSDLPESLSGGELPDWLDHIDTPPPLPSDPGEGDIIDSPEALTAALDALPPTPDPTESLAKADMPDWVKTLHPARSTVETIESMHKQGPLTGVRGVVDIEPIIAAPRQIHPYSASFVVTPEQRQQATLLQQLVRDDSLPMATGTPIISMVLPRWLRLLLALLLLLALAVGLQRPFSLPTPAPAPAVEAAAALLEQAAGQPVLLVFGYTPALAGELTPAAQTLLTQLAAQDSPVLTLSQAAAGTAVAASEAAAAQPLGFLPGEALGVRLLQPCLVAPCTTLAGKPLSADVGSQLAAVELLILLTGEQQTLVNWVEQRSGDIPLLVVTTQALKPAVGPYLHTGQVTGASSGLAELAQLQQQVGRVNDATSGRLQAQTVGQLLSLLLLLGGALFYGLRPRPQLQEEVA